MNIPDEEYLPASLPVYAPGDRHLQFVRRRDARGDLVVKYEGVPSPATPEAGHSLWRGEQRFPRPIAAVAANDSYVYVALQGGTLYRFSPRGTGVNFLGTTPDVQAFGAQVVGLAATSDRLYVALASGWAVAYDLGGSGASFLGVKADGTGWTVLPGGTSHVRGAMPAHGPGPMRGIAANESYVYVAEQHLVTRYDRDLEGGPASQAFAPEVRAIAATAAAVFVALDRGDRSRVVRYGLGQPGKFLFGVTATNEVSDASVPYQDLQVATVGGGYKASVTGLWADERYVHVETAGNRVVYRSAGEQPGLLKRDCYQLNYLLKYPAGASGRPMWGVGGDGVVPAAGAASKLIHHSHSSGGVSCAP